MLSSPIIRVSRKRTADPHSALVVESKRQKQDQLFFSLFKTSDAPEFKENTCTNPIIDFQECTPLPENDPSNPLAFATNSVNEVGGPEPSGAKFDTEVLTVNGRPLIPVGGSKDDIVYDFYKIVRGEIGEGLDDWNMRFATKEEEMLVNEGESDSDDHVDDDDDSNDESNWRNDYPDEEGDSSGESESHGEAWGNDEYDSQCSSDDGLRLKMQRFGFEEHSDTDEDFD